MLVKLKGILGRALQKTAPAWPELRVAYQWIHQAAQILENEAELPQSEVEKHFQDLIESISAQKTKVGSLAAAIEHFLKITRSYWSGLFHCYSVDGLPRTNNDLEHIFGSFRHHQRRCTGQKKAPASLLVRGSCRLIAARREADLFEIATKIKTFTATDLLLLDLSAWRQKRSQMQKLRDNRLAQRRFRHSTETYLAELETKLIQSILPP